MKVLVADKLEAVAVQGLAELGAELISEPDLAGDTLVRAAADNKPDVVIVRSTKVPAEVQAAAGGSLRLIIRAGAGTDNIDKDAAASAGIAVCNCPGPNAVAVAELTMGHLIGLDRFLPEQDAELKSGRWNKKRYAAARGLKGRSLVVIGTGAIGLEVIKRAKAFDMRVAAQSRSLTRSMAEALGVGWIPFTREALLEALPGFDAVSMHVAVVDETRGMCDERFFAAMKDGAFFINTARGGVVSDGALIDALRAGRVRAALDVFNDQPADKSADWACPYADVPGVVLSHHNGASTEQAQLAVAEEVVRIAQIYRDEGRFEHCVNGVG
ncbi:MAG: NAD(P)-dependent oxidoreductase [Planctomycetota bacterium]